MLGSQIKSNTPSLNASTCWMRVALADRDIVRWFEDCRREISLRILQLKKKMKVVQIAVISNQFVP